MAQSTTISRPRAIEIGRKVDPYTCEQLLAKLPNERQSTCLVRLASQFGAELFADLWAAILVGTICRRHYSDLKIITWGIRDWSPDSAFAASLAGLTAIQLSDRVRTYTTESPVDIDKIEYAISHQRGGILEKASFGKTRTLLEFDPQNPIAAKIQGRTERRLSSFGDLIWKFLGDLELGYRDHGIPDTSRGFHRHLTSFLGELHENAYKYSRSTSHDRRTLRGLRIVRVKAHLAASKNELLNRASNDALIKDYLSHITDGRGSYGVMEAIVSDFGNGIVDHFLSSQRGQEYRSVDRRKLIHSLVHETLSSSIDPGSGLGIGKALEAARGMKGLVSLRTGEFSLAGNFADPTAEQMLIDVGEKRAKVAGTHWQILWPMMGI